ncbi:MAG TPA: HAD family hydrolase [Acidobacteriaceae bacterium]|nr:HAD family hydrolase [Acidobacteriaceae bacterium]
MRPVLSTPAAPRVFIQDGFRWDRQHAYLFDIDGTLLRHRDRIHFDAFFHGVRSVLGRDLALDGVILAGNTDPGILRDAFRLAQVEDAAWRPHREGILNAMCAHFIERRAGLLPTVMPGVEATLAHLERRGALLGLATGNLEQIGWIKVENAGLRSWFSFGGFCDRFEDRADMIAHAAVQARTILHDSSATVCVVGDTPYDIQAARANSLPTVAVATGRYSFDQLMEQQPEVCATTLETLLQATTSPASEPPVRDHVS